MSDKAKEVDATLERAGFELVRSRKHLVLRNPEGKTFTMAATPSDRRAFHRQLRDIRRVLTPAPSDGGGVDAEIQKQGKKRGGLSQPANVDFKFYCGLAPRSVPSTPENTIKTLQGYLRSKNSYKFKSELQKEFLRLMNEATKDFHDLLDACVRDLAIMLPRIKRSIATDEEIACDSEEEFCKFKIFEATLNLVKELAAELEGRQWSGDELVEVTIKKLKEDCRYRNKPGKRPDELTERAHLIELCGRAANRILRGDSASEIKAFIEADWCAQKYPLLYEWIEELAIEQMENASV